MDRLPETQAQARAFVAAVARRAQPRLARAARAIVLRAMRLEFWRRRKAG